MEEDAGETTQLREAVRAAVMSKHEAQLGEVIFASSTGDLALVKKLVREGLDIDSGDYDMRTTLHLASAEGSITVVMCLLEEAADPNVQDRWGNNPIQDALNGRHVDVIQALLAAGGTITVENSAELMCKAAADAEIDLMRNLVSFGVSVDVGDYDNRTALHLAAAEGALKVDPKTAVVTAWRVYMFSFHGQVVEFLISAGGDINVKDRWNGACACASTH